MMTVKASGTAGIPILEVLKKQQLKDTAVVVTRYFGGIKLGAGGLIRAYGNTTSQAIKATGVVKRQRMQGFSIIVDYTLSGKLEHAFRQSNYILKTINYTDKVEFIVYVEVGQEKEFREFIVDHTNAQAEITEADTTYIEIDM